MIAVAGRKSLELCPDGRPPDQKDPIAGLDEPDEGIGALNHGEDARSRDHAELRAGGGQSQESQVQGPADDQADG